MQVSQVYMMHRVSRRGLLTVFAVAVSTVFALLALNAALFSPSRLKTGTPTPKALHAVISPSSYSYILNQPDLCEKRRPHLILMIPLTVRDAEVRAAIRATWGHERLISRVNTSRLFVIGLPAQINVTLQERLVRESEEYGDIIQMDFVDTYHNLTIKTMMIMNWIATCCRAARYAMKIDADNFLNVPLLLNYLRGLGESSKEDFITGSVIKGSRPNRNSLSKWFLSEELYPDTSYPPYLSGAAYVFSADLALKISLASRFVKPVPLEDVYVGLCLNVLGVTPVYSTRFLGFVDLFEVRNVKYERCAFAQRITVNRVTPQQLLHIWPDFENASFTC